jgi:hypothetical protein
MAKRKKRKVPLGKIKPWSDETIDRLATITPEDIEKAKAEVIDELKPFLDAEQKEDKDVVG